MVVRFTKSSGVLERSNDYEVYYGTNDKGRTVFPKVADTLIKAEGTLANIEFIDINKDGRREVIVSAFDIGLSQIVSALLSGSIDQDVMVFSMNDEGNFSEDATLVKEVELKFSLSSGSSGEPVIRLEDITGDGFKDLLLSNGTSLKLYVGQDDKNLFARRAVRQKLLLPQDGAMVSSDDINFDGKTDLVMRYGRQDPAELSKRITLLLAR
jgi:hypothetical protein